MSWKRRNHAMLIYSACFVLYFLYFCEKNAVMKSNGVKSISCVYLRRVRKAMWTHRALPNPGPSSLLLCKASQRRSSSSLREKLFIFLWEVMYILKKSYKYKYHHHIDCFPFYVNFLAHYEKLKIPFCKKTNCPPKWLADSPARGGFVKWLVSLIL